jgi:hypothetical protein
MSSSSPCLPSRCQSSGSTHRSSTVDSLLYPVPLRATTAVPPVVELLLTVSFPVAAPVVVGSNWTCNVTDWFAFSVTGKL